MKLTEETIHGIASKHWITIVNPTRYTLASTDFARAIESTVRQQDAELVRELVEALNRVVSIECNTVSHRKGEFHSYDRPCPVVSQIETALTRAQQWLEENQC